MANNHNENAFPFQSSEASHMNEAHHGLTKREYFAAKAMQGLLSNNIYHNPNEKHEMISVYDLSRAAIDYADELLKQLDHDSK